MSAPSRPAPLRGFFLICAAAVSWGTTGSVTTLLVAQSGVTPLVIAAVRALAGAVFLLAGAWLIEGSLRIARADRWRCVAMGVAMAAFQASFFTAVTLSGIALTALIAICSAPLVIAGLAWAFLGERPTARVGVALALGVVGTALLIVGPRGIADVSSRLLAGGGLAFTAGIAYGTYVVITKSTLARSAPLPMAGLSFAVATLALAPALAAPDALRQLAVGWPWLLYLGAVTTAGAYAAYTIGLRDVSASVAGIASLVEPLTATLLGVVVFGERLGVAGAAGAVLLLGALAILARTEQRG
ncbi:MAG TPA: EamA family transporter [Methylomirabilota bacterium]|nr:EamA family transporter [Methylomirabilota bacterium]